MFAMRRLSLCAFFCWIIVLPALASVIIRPTSLYASNDDIDATRKTTLGVVPDAFNVIPYFEETRLPLFSVLFSIVQALLDEGLEDFNGSMEIVSWVLDDYPEVGITISPNHFGGTMERKFAIWGLCQSASIMINAKKFQAGQVRLQWEDEDVGSIRFSWAKAPRKPRIRPTTKPLRRNAVQDVPANAAWKDPENSELESSHGATTLRDLTSTTAVSAGEEFQLQISALDTVAQVHDVFELVILVMADAAAMGISHAMEGYVSPRFLPKIDMHFFAPPQPRKSPPFFTGKWLLRVAAAIPKFLIKRGAFREVLMHVDVDGVRVADGFMKNTGRRAGLQLPSSNISVV